MDQEALNQLITAHARFPAALAAILPLEQPELLREREVAGRWSPLEILVHLRDEEVEDFRARATAAAAGRLWEKEIDPAGWVSKRNYNAQDPRAVLHDFVRERADSVTWLRSVTLEMLDHSVEHPRLGRMRCGDFIAAWRVHDLLHLRQLATALAVLSARRLDGWHVEYAGTIPNPGTTI